MKTLARITNAEHHHRFYTGDIVNVLERDGGSYYPYKVKRILDGAEGWVRESDLEFIGCSFGYVEELEKRVAELEEELSDLREAVSELCEDGWVIGSYEPSRKEVIEMAKEDVKELMERMYNGMFETEGNRTFRYFTTVPHFTIDRDAKTVKVEVRGAFNPRLYETAEAKAKDDEVFNAHILKAIALRKALGLSVPEEYYNVKQPEKAEVGDVVRGTQGFYEGKIFKLTHKCEKGGFYYERLDKSEEDRYVSKSDWIYEHQFELIDDTKE